VSSGLVELTRGRPVVVIAPHPDDEVLGAGGTIARFARMGVEVHVVVLTSGRAPRFTETAVQAVRAEASEAHAVLGVRHTHWLGFPAAELSEHPHADLNAGLGRIMQEVEPNLVLAPHPGDIHLDHQLAFLSTLVASRPHSARHPTFIAAYETLSETNWNAPYLTPAFVPNLFVDIGETLELKLEAFRRFASQVKPAPHERSLGALSALATLRGATVHLSAAEAFVLVRAIL
jgi:LmbE family N-acetylglucosaminyl deacetylase